MRKEVRRVRGERYFKTVSLEFRNVPFADGEFEVSPGLIFAIHTHAYIHGSARYFSATSHTTMLAHALY